MNEESAETEEADNQDLKEANAEYRRILENWMEGEKPYLNPEFRLMDLRQVLPLNRTYLSQLINNEYGCSFYQFVTNYRIEEAKRLMREQPDMKFQEVSDQCGFSSPTVFSRVFVREVGMTPRDWSSKTDNPKP
jgi:AraC-like DNA-binding protein